MPSLKVSNSSRSARKDTFSHFYQALVHERTKPSSAGYLSFAQELAKCVVVLIIVTNVILFVTLGWANVFNYYSRQTFVDYHLNYVFDTTQVIIPCFVVCWLMEFLFFNHDYRSSARQIGVIAFLVCIVISGTIVIILAVEYGNGNYMYLEFMCNLRFSNFENEYYSWYCQLVFSLYLIYSTQLSVAFCLLLMIWINRAVNAVKRIRSRNDFDYHISEKNDLSINSFEVNLLPEDGVDQTKNHSCCDGKVCLYSLFCVMLALSFFILTLDDNLVFYFQNTRYFYYYAIIMTTIFKIILKRLGRAIDMQKAEELQSNESLNQQRRSYWYDFVSLELTMEITMNLVYCNLYYTGLTIEFGLLNNFENFVYITCFHASSEVFHSIFRFSRQYYNVTNTLYSHSLNFSSTRNSKLLGSFLRSISDGSTFEEWIIRHSIDMSFRAISVVCTVSYFLIQYASYGRDYWGFEDDIQFYRALLYLAMSFGIDVMYFFALFVCYYCVYDYNIWRPFLSMCRADFRVVLATFVIPVFLLQIFL